MKWNEESETCLAERLDAVVVLSGTDVAGAGRAVDTDTMVLLTAVKRTGGGGADSWY